MADVTERNIGSVIKMASINPDEKTDLATWLKMVEQIAPRAGMARRRTAD